ncbi:hypothetical protein BDGGKGIB_01697 [Nodularia sphaerocarpa UHCC 0038]|nr:hypothetical protein BDGGKGIB_01697 [Nodularia sphaerocarpa UHCC 0038]
MSRILLVGLSLVIGHLSFVICHLSFVICHLSFVICHWEITVFSPLSPASSPHSPENAGKNQRHRMIVIFTFYLHCQPHRQTFSPPYNFCPRNIFCLETSASFEAKVDNFLLASTGIIEIDIYKEQFSNDHILLQGVAALWLFF